MIQGMSRHTRQRFMTTLVLIASLLFQQVAMAAYVCTMPQMQAASAMMADDCVAMESPPAQPPDTVCQKHCAPDPTSSDTSSIPPVPALTLPPLLHAFVLAPASRGCVYASSDVFARSHPPPHLRYCCLLI